MLTQGTAIETRQSEWYRTRALGARAVVATALLVADWCSVGGSGCEPARARQRVAVGTGCWYEQGRRLLWLRPPMATGSGEADAVKLRATEAGTRMAQSGLGRAGRWLVQAVAVATAAVKVTQGFAMRGRE